MKSIPLTHNLEAIVDEQDYERMNAHYWYALLTDNKQRKKQRTVKIVTELPRKRDEKRKEVEFGEMLLNYDKEKQYLTFKNHNRLDFRRDNLLLVPIELAKYHQASQSSSSSKYKGVHYSKSKERYIVAIQIDGKTVRIGSSKIEDEAAKMYNEYTKKRFGKYAFQNIIGKDNRKPVYETNPIIQHRTKKQQSGEWRGVQKRENNHYQAVINKEHLGTFHTPEDAAYAYNQRAKEIFGEKALLNELPKDFIGSPPINEIHLFGKIYKNYDEVAKTYGLPKTTLHNRIKKMSLEEAVKLGKAKPKFRLKGISIRKLAIEHQVNRHRLGTLLKEGFSIEEAIQKIKN